MKRLVFIQYPNPLNPHSHGGMAVSMHEVLKRLSRDYQVEVHTGYLGDKTGSCNLDGVRYIHYAIGTGRWPNRASFSWRSTSANWQAADLTVIPWSRYAPVFLRQKHAPAVIELHADYFSTPSQCPALEPLAKALLLQAVRKSGHVICVSQAVKKEVLKRTGSNLHSEVIYNGLPEDLFKADTTPAAEYLLFVGRLDIRGKGLDLLLQAYKHSQVKLPMVIAGDGADRARLELLISELGLSDKVTLPGWLAGPAKWEVMRRAAAVVVPSISEGFGLTALEASGLGRPVIASEVGGLKEIVRNGETGLLVQPSIEALSAAMQTIVNSREQAEAMGKTGAAFAADFTWDKAVKARVAFYQEAIELSQAARQN